MVEITLPILLQIVQTVGILVGIVYYLIIMRNSQRTRELTLQSQELTRKTQEQALETRQTQLLMHIYQDLSSEANLRNWIEIMSYEFEDYDDFNKKYGSAFNKEAFAKRYSIWRMFDGIGLLLRDGLLNADRVYDLIDSAVIQQWEKWGPIIREYRKEGWPDGEEGFEYLYDEMMRVRGQRGISREFFLVTDKPELKT
jgi:hypothetical protein